MREVPRGLLGGRQTGRLTVRAALTDILVYTETSTNLPALLPAHVNKTT